MCHLVYLGFCIPYWPWKRMTPFMSLLLQNDHFPIAEFKHLKLRLNISLLLIIDKLQ